MRKLTAKEEAFCNAVVLNGGDKVKAYEDAGYSMKMSIPVICTQADKTSKKPHVALRIKSLTKEANKVALNKFSISVQQRLEWLDEIREAGMDTYKDQAGNERRESLTASNAAIKTMNEMLGTDNDDKTAESLNITFSVKSPVGDIKITKGK
jgi:hypothetical protein